MNTLNSDLEQLWFSLGMAEYGPSASLQFIAADSGEGTSLLAREFAAYAARRMDRPVWLVSLEPGSAVHIGAIQAQPWRFGPLGEMKQASPDRSMFFEVWPEARDHRGGRVVDADYLVAYGVCEQRLWVTEFRTDLLDPDQVIQVTASPAYWNALKAYSGLIIVDCPALDRSIDGLTTAPFMDQSVIVLAADGASVRGPALLKNALMAAGANCVGLVFNRDPARRGRRPKILQRLR
jgi:hypothetical protein